MRAKVRRGNCRRLLTWTNGGEGEGWGSFVEALHDVMEWYALEGVRLLGDTPFLAVAERGSKGRIHVHGAIRKGYRLDYSAIIRSWSGHMEGKGFHSRTGTHRFHAGDDHGKHTKGFHSARQCADYMAKYLGKGFLTDARALYEKRYRTVNLHLDPPRRVGGFLLSEVENLLRQTFPGRHREVTWYESPDGDYGGFFIEIDSDDP